MQYEIPDGLHMNDVADKKWGSLKNENTLKYDTSQPELGNS